MKFESFCVGLFHWPFGTGPSLPPPGHFRSEEKPSHSRVTIMPRRRFVICRCAGRWCFYFIFRFCMCALSLTFLPNFGENRDALRQPRKQSRIEVGFRRKPNRWWASNSLALDSNAFSSLLPVSSSDASKAIRDGKRRQGIKKRESVRH